MVDDKLKDSFDIDGDTGPCLLNIQFVGAYMLDSKSVTKLCNVTKLWI